MAENSIAYAHKILLKYWGYASLRPKQQEVVSALLEGRSVVALLPTGGGKSICYQVPAMMTEGLTIVVSPLISLMEDQVEHLKRIGIKAEAIHSGQSSFDIDRILENCRFGAVKMLYVSPERLASEMFLQRIMYCRIDLVAIDEAHCISQWGHDFRPSYLNIRDFIGAMPGVGLIALTASATPVVIQEIIELLDLQQPALIRDSFNRENLKIRINKTNTKINDLLNSVAIALGKTIIYCRSRRQVQMIAESLQREGIRAEYYHAGLDYKLKSKIQEKFKTGKINCIVATNAFGMGIDVNDVRQVYHYGLPPSIEEYYQEIGRAGRDGHSSIVSMYYDQSDVRRLEESLTIDYPIVDTLVHYYKLLHVHYGIEIDQGEGRNIAFDIYDLAQKYSLNAKVMNGIVKALGFIGVLSIIYNPKPVFFVKYLLRHRDLHSIQLDQDADQLCQYLMRSYEGIWDQWIKIKSKKVPKRYHKNEELLEADLTELRKKGVLRMYKMDAGPRIVFLQNRLASRDVDKLFLNYNALKERKADRIKGMLSLLATEDCRMANMLAYFGEEELSPCGQCDNCTEAQQVIYSKKEIMAMSDDQIKALLSHAQRTKNLELLSLLQELYSEGLISHTSITS